MVPKGWSKLSLKKLLTLNYGKSPKEIIDENGAYDIVGTGGITGSTNKYLHSEPSVIIGRKGTIDKPQYLDKPFWAIDTTFYCVPIDNNKVDIKWFYQYSKLINWKNYNEASGVPSLSRETIYSIQVATPPITEQLKIVKVLSTWDKAISTTERLIDNSTQQKKALMQQLLTGKKRLLDDEGNRFEGEWEDSKLGSLYSFKRGKGISKGQLTENGNKCVLYGELYTHYGEVIREVKSRTTETNSIKSIKGDVLIPASTTTTGIDLANATAILEDNILLGGDINILRPKKSIDAIFMAHLLTHTKKFEIARKGQGITIIHVYGKDLASLDVSIPSNLKEQQKIATVLTNADKEIELLGQQLADLQQEKKALMQVLLTGKKRVVVDGEVA